MPTYGDGEEAGNEGGYIVGMSTCYPKPGSVRVADGELLTVVSNYSSAQMHTGVMGLFYILVAEPRPQPKSSLPLHNLASSCKLSFSFVFLSEFGYGYIKSKMIAMSTRNLCMKHRGPSVSQFSIIKPVRKSLLLQHPVCNSQFA